MTPDAALARHTDQLSAIWEDLLALKRRLEPVYPEDLVLLKERLSRLHPEGGPKRVADYDLFYRVGMVLSHDREPLTMGELSEELDVPLSTATRMVDWLVQSGYAIRLPDPADRRVVRVALSTTGQELYRTLSAFIRERIEGILRRFSAEEREILVLLLRKLVKSLQEEAG